MNTKHAWGAVVPYGPRVFPDSGSTLVEGELPPGAVTVEIRAAVDPVDLTVADGRYRARVPVQTHQDALFVLFRDEAGAIVPRPIDGETSRRPVEDASGSCGACGGRTWDVVERDGREAVVCHTCGLADATWFETSRRRRSMRRPRESDHEDEERDALEVWTHPVDARSGRLEWHARGAMRQAIQGDAFREVVRAGRSGEAEIVLRHDLARRIMPQVDRTGPDEIEVVIGRRSTVFTRVRADNIEAAAGIVDGTLVMLAARGRSLDGLRLDRL